MLNKMKHINVMALY